MLFFGLYHICFKVAHFLPSWGRFFSSAYFDFVQVLLTSAKCRNKTVADFFCQNYTFPSYLKLLFFFLQQATAKAIINLKQGLLYTFEDPVATEIFLWVMQMPCFLSNFLSLPLTQ